MSYYKQAYKGVKYASKKSSNIPWWAIALIAFYFYFKGKSSGGWFGGLFGGSSDDETTDPDEFFDSNNIASEKFTINLEQAETHAENLKLAFEAVNFGGTDLETIETIVYNINEYDLGLIHERFGTPNYFLTGSGGIFDFGDPASLKDWIGAEIDSSETVYIELKKKYKKINIHLI